MNFAERRHWIFDMDGTLTVPMHDFEWLRAQLDIDPSMDILAELNRRSPGRAARDHAFIAEWENGLARRAKAQQDATALLRALRAAGHRVGVLTRNTQSGARLTLAAAGLREFFDDAYLLGRDDAVAKPDPAGVVRLMSAWGAAPTDTVMVGDWIHDIRAGRAAGTGTVLVRRRPTRQPWESEADRVVDDLTTLICAPLSRSTA
jgi:HAD superfamily hydrolase (TIGR01509 family)